MPALGTMNIVGGVIFLVGLIVAIFGLKQAAEDVSWGLPVGGLGVVIGAVGGFLFWYYSVLILLLLIMLFSMHLYKSRQQIWGRPFAGGIGVFAVILAVAKMFYVGGGCDQAAQSEKWQDINSIVQTSKMEIVGKYLADNYPGVSITLVTPPKYPNQPPKSQELFNAQIAALKKGLGGKITVGSTVAAMDFSGKSEDEMMMAGGMDMLTAARLDEIVSNNSGNKMIVLMGSFPYDFQNLTFWRPPEGQDAWEAEQDDERYKLVVLDNGGTQELGQYIAGKYVNVLVSYKPGFKFDPDNYTLPDGGAQAVFDERFLIISDKNIQEVAQEYPSLFPKSE